MNSIPIGFFNNIIEKMVERIASINGRRQNVPRENDLLEIISLVSLEEIATSKRDFVLLLKRSHQLL